LYCASCGNAIPAGARFCQICGAATTPGDQPAAAWMYGYDATRTEYAGFWVRFGARLIDAIVLGVIGNIAYLPVVPFFNVNEIVQFETAPDGTIESFEFDTGQFFAYIGLISTISTVIDAIYFIACTTRWGQTLGKKAVGIKVVDADGNLLRPGAATVRWIGSIVSGIILLIGYLMAVWDERKQALHDKMAGSFVVKAPNP
jgi:uncharacterized RDD family membrane protein YckC